MLFIVVLVNVSFKFNIIKFNNINLIILLFIDYLTISSFLVAAVVIAIGRITLLVMFLSMLLLLAITVFVLPSPAKGYDDNDKDNE